MKLIRSENYEDMCKKIANIVAEQLLEKPDSVLGLATGSTMLGVYEELVKKYDEKIIDFSKVKSFNLDEYLGLSPSNPQSYTYYMENNFFKHINIKPENAYLPDGGTSDEIEECKKYDELISASGGIDLQLLGLGLDGHIGFNEPGKYFFKNSHCVELDESTIKANARFFKDEKDVPRKALTIGIGAIMSAKIALLCVNGKAKKSILKAVLSENITPEIPGTILQLHKNLIVVADEEALGD